ncbi:MAG: saccharopine dehydrogenase NADP-binding domain-containing protein [Acidimicrobiales bacterium]
MENIPIIGAGGVGRVVAHKCAQLEEVFPHITLASRTKSKCDQIAAEVLEKTGRTIDTSGVDADSVPELVALPNESNRSWSSTWPCRIRI